MAERASAGALLWLLLETLASYTSFPTEQTSLGQEMGPKMVRSPVELSCQTAVEPHIPNEWGREALHVQHGPGTGACQTILKILLPGLWKPKGRLKCSREEEAARVGV